MKQKIIYGMLALAVLGLLMLSGCTNNWDLIVRSNGDGACIQGTQSDARIITTGYDTFDECRIACIEYKNRGGNAKTCHQVYGE